MCVRVCGCEREGLNIGGSEQVARVGAKFVIGEGNIYIAQTVIISHQCPRSRLPLSLSVFLLSHRMYLLISFRKSTPTRIRQLILYIGNSKGYVDGFVGELNPAKRLGTRSM